MMLGRSIDRDAALQLWGMLITSFSYFKPSASLMNFEIIKIYFSVSVEELELLSTYSHLFQC